MCGQAPSRQAAPHGRTHPRRARRRRRGSRAAGRPSCWPAEQGRWLGEQHGAFKLVGSRCTRRAPCGHGWVAGVQRKGAAGAAWSGLATALCRRAPAGRTRRAGRWDRTAGSMRSGRLQQADKGSMGGAAVGGGAGRLGFPRARLPAGTAAEWRPAEGPHNAPGITPGGHLWRGCLHWMLQQAPKQLRDAQVRSHRPAAAAAPEATHPAARRTSG